MNQFSTEPEYTLEESVKIPLMGNKLVSFDRDWQALQVDLEVLSRQVTRLVDTSSEIEESFKDLVSWLQEQQ